MATARHGAIVKFLSGPYQAVHKTIDAAQDSHFLEKADSAASLKERGKNHLDVFSYGGV